MSRLELALDKFVWTSQLTTTASLQSKSFQYGFPALDATDCVSCNSSSATLVFVRDEGDGAGKASTGDFGSEAAAGGTGSTAGAGDTVAWCAGGALPVTGGSTKVSGS